MALLAATVWAMWRRFALGLLGAWFFLILAPTSSFVPIKDLAFEHRMYLPLASAVMAGVMVFNAALRAIGQRLSWSARWQQLVTGCVVIALTAVLVIRTVIRNKDYRSEEGMWISVATLRPDNARAHFNLGNILSRRNDRDGAIENYRRTIQADKHHLKARFNMAVALQNGGRAEEAIQEYEALLDLSPHFVQARTNLGVLLLAESQLDDAEQQIRLALDALDADRYPHTGARVLCNLGKILAATQRMDEAIDVYRRATTLNPRSLPAHYGLGVAYSRRGDTEHAISQFRKCLSLNPDNEAAKAALASLTSGG